MARIIDLHGGDVLRLDAAAGAQVRVLFGDVWLTEPRRLDDVFAASGEAVVLAHGGQVLVEARGFARLIVPAPRPPLAGLRARLQALAQRLLPAPSFSNA